MARWIVIESLASDPRPLGVAGEYLTGSYSQLSVAEFSSEGAAERAAAAATNRREGSTVSVIGQTKRALA